MPPDLTSRRENEGGVIVILNLLKADPRRAARGGRYSAAFEKCLEAAGGRVVYSDDIARFAPKDEAWRAVALVEYPSRKAFDRVAATRAYQEIVRRREAGLERTMFYATAPQ
jgi:uncharacterized protein (DUF1330 family)